jgi:PKD repeat protein
MAVNHTFPVDGSYSVALVVTDSGGNSDTAVKTVTVSAPTASNSEPVATFTASCTDLQCTFDASDSSDTDGTIVSYVWTFGDGNNGDGVTVTHGFSGEGSYPVTLNVTDNQGASSQFTTSVTVSEPVVAVSSIELSGIGYKVKGQKWAELSWAGSEASQVRIFRDDSELVVTENTGSYRDDSVDNPTKSAVYKVCEATGAVCSNEVEVTF